MHLANPGRRFSKRWVVIATFLVTLASNVISIALFGGWDRPPRKSDGLEYDNIALNLARGRGFGFFIDDPEYREPYFRSDNTDRRRTPATAPPGESFPYTATAFRPPAFPFALAAIYRVFGRHFLIWRLLNCAIVAAAVALTVCLIWRIAAPFPAAIVGVLGVCDPLLKKNAGYYLTDGPACLGVVLLAWSLVLILEHKRLIHVMVCGTTLAALLLLRSIFILWYPLVAALALWCWTRCDRRSTGLAIGVFLAAVLLLPMPWWIRNCIALDAFMPLGTQGGIGLPGGYSDAAVEASGVWVDPHTWGCFDPVHEQLRGQQYSPIELERAKAKFGTRLALDWIWQHPHLWGKLAASKLVTLWTMRPKGYFVVLLALGLLGLRWSWRRPGAVIAWALIACNSLVVMATYCTRSGRFQVPVLLLLHAVAAIGLWRVSQWSDQKRQTSAGQVHPG